MERTTFTACYVLLGLLVCVTVTSAATTAGKMTTKATSQTTPIVTTKVSSQTTPEVTTKVSTQTTPRVTTKVSSQTTLEVATEVSTRKIKQVPTKETSKTTPGVTTKAVSQTTPGVTTKATSQTTSSAPTTTTENIRDLILRLIRDGIREGMTNLMKLINPNVETTTKATGTTASREMTSSSTQASTGSSSTTAPKASLCPQGVYDQNSETVIFSVEDRDCKITVYLKKPPKGSKKPKKEKKAKMDKQGKKGGNDRKDPGRDRNPDGEQRQGSERFLEKNISVRPIFGIDLDLCPEFKTQQYGKNDFVMETNECIMYVKNLKKGKGKDRSTTPLILSHPLTQ